MPYTIGTVIYGYPMNERQAKLLELWQEGIDLIDDDKYDLSKWDPNEGWPEIPLAYPVEPSQEKLSEEDVEFEGLYTGTGQNAGYCGVVLDEFDECDSVRLDKNRLARWKPTPAQKCLARKRLERVPTKFRKLADPAGVYIVWSSS